APRHQRGRAGVRAGDERPRLTARSPHPPARTRRTSPGAAGPSAPHRGASAGAAAPAVLDLYDDPGWYDATYRRRRADVRYYVERARQCGGPVLEYGVGSGRVALPTVRAGVSVAGVDAGAPMLALLEDKRRRLPSQRAALLRAVRGGLRAVRLRERFRLVTAPLEVGVRAGVSVAGVDASAPMLALLEDKRRRLPSKRAALLRAVRGDMRAVRLRERFRLVTAPFNVVLHLDSRRDMERWLARVREHLLPEGELVFDVSVPQPLDLAADPTIWEKARSFRHPESGRLTELAERFEYDPIRQVLLVESELRTEGAPRPLRVPLIHRQWFPRELEALLHYNGFVDIRFTADFTDLPPDDHVDSLVISCRVGPLR